MSELQSISHIWMRCKLCIHQSMTSVTNSIRLKGKTTKVAEILNKTVCSKCGCSEVPEYRIIYLDASESAMLSAVREVRAD